MIGTLLRNLVGRLYIAVGRGGLLYWEARARKYGVRSVLNLGHADDEVEEVTRRQREILFPLLGTQLRGTERTVLDFGCGPGRFTAGLADLIGGRAIGVDPIQTLLELASRAPNVEYRLLENGAIPAADASVDVAWICLVLGVITDPTELNRTTGELTRVLRPDGLLFLVENTAEREGNSRMCFRSVEAYQALFPQVALEHLGDYEDVGERISVLAGRLRR